MNWNLLDIGSIAVTITIVEFLKPLVAERFIPLLPFGVAYLVAFIVVGNAGYNVFTNEFFLKWVNEGLKIALASMSAWKIYTTTIKGNNTIDDVLDFSLEEDEEEQETEEEQKVEEGEKDNDRLSS